MGSITSFFKETNEISINETDDLLVRTDLELITNNLPSNSNLDYSNIIAGYGIVLDHKRKVLLHYDQKWKLPGGRLSCDSEFEMIHQLCEIIYRQTGVSVDIRSLVGLRTNHIVYYLCDISSSSAFFDRPIAYFSFSQLIETDAYLINKPIFNQIYAPYKIQLVLDLDQTLLQSLILQPIGLLRVKDEYFFQHCPAETIVTLDDQWTVYVWMRPFLREFLRIMSELTCLSYWTAGTQQGQSKILHSLKIEQYAQRAHFADTCSVDVNQYIYKSFTDLNQRLRHEGCEPYDLDRAFLIDDLELTKKYNELNCLLIYPWQMISVKSEWELYHSLLDNHLSNLVPMIKHWSDRVIHDGQTIPNIFHHMSSQH